MPVRLEHGGDEWPGRSRSIFVVVDQDAVGRPFRILELPIAQCPEKGSEAGKAQSQRNRDQEQQSIHRTVLAKRSELAITTSELADIAAAAISGVSIPESASGTAKIL